MEIVIDKEIAGKDIRTLLRQDMGFSSAMLKKLKFSEGGILVNGSFVTVRYELQVGDVLSVAVEDRQEDVSPYIVPVEMELPVLYEDDALTVVNKPPDMPSHPSFGHRDDTVANALAWRYRDRTYVFRPVNRLDRDTSGVMLTSNTKLASYRMFLAMRQGEIRKSYVAVAEGVPKQKEGRIEGYMRRRAESVIERQVCPPEDPGAQLAVTEYRVLWENGKNSVILASPITGRTHQIRVQLTSVGCPLCGDTLYGSESLYIRRHALHAVATSFPHPDGRPMTVRAPLPDDMTELIRALFPDSAEVIFKEINDLC
ncbi:MAG: RluA family pseudouridine synthase [Clostridia bacterium]|nr:RluA family pseudouridine synthase [Clostridia bacterium]